MDIGYLLALQEFRDGAGAFLADFFLKMTYFGEDSERFSEDHGLYIQTMDT